MKITKDNFMKATAIAMETQATKELFKKSHEAEELFTTYSFLLSKRVIGKDVNDETFANETAEVIVSMSDKPIMGVEIITALALVIFSNRIWESLENLNKPQEKDLKYNTFKSELKSKID